MNTIKTDNAFKGITRRKVLTLATASGVAMSFVLCDAVARGKAINVGVVMPLSPK